MGDINWCEWLDLSLWTIGEAVCLTQKDPALPPSFFGPYDTVGEWVAAIKEAETNPLYKAALRALEFGQLTNHSKDDEVIKFEPLEFLRWRSRLSSAGPLAPELLKFLAEHGSQEEVAHGNVMVNAKKREELLGVALWCLYNCSDSCVKNGRPVAAAVARQINLNYPSVFPGRSFDRNEAHTANLLASYFKFGTADREPTRT